MAPGFNSSNNRLSLAREFTQRAVRFAMARGEWKSPSHEGDRKSKTPAGAGRSGADATDRWRVGWLRVDTPNGRLAIERPMRGLGNHYQDRFSAGAAVTVGLDGLEAIHQSADRLESRCEA